MKKLKLWIPLVILIAWLPFIIAAWDNDLPADNSTWNNAAAEIRANWDALEAVLGVDLDMGTVDVDVNDLIVKESPWLDVLAYDAVGDGTTDDSTAFQAAIDACPTGGIVFVPPATYRVANLVINKPMTFKGVGLGSKLQAVAAATGYIIKVDGTAAGVVTRTSLGFDGGAHTCNVIIQDLYLEGNDRGASIGGLYINQADWGTYKNLTIFNFAREAINCYSGLRESIFDNIKTRWCGDGTTYPNINLNDQAAVTAESHNNLLFRGLFSIYAVGDHVQMDTINGKSFNVRNIRFENCQFHGITATSDGSGNNPFDMTYTSTQKAYRIFDIGTAEGTSITNCLFNPMGLEVPGIDIATGSNGNPTYTRILNNRIMGRYDSSATANDIGIHLQNGALVLAGNTITGTSGSSIIVKTDSGTSLYYGTNYMGGGALSLAGTLHPNSITDSGTTLLGSVSWDSSAANDTETTIFTCTTGKSAIVTHVIVRGAIVKDAVVTLGIGGGNADEFLGDQTLSAMTAATEYVVLYLDQNTHDTPENGHIVLTTETFVIEITTQDADGGTAIVEAFGYLF